VPSSLASARSDGLFASGSYCHETSRVHTAVARDSSAGLRPRFIVLFRLRRTKQVQDGPHDVPAFFPMKKPHKSTCLLRIILPSLAFVESVLTCTRLACTRRRKKPPHGALLWATRRGSDGTLPAAELLSHPGIPGCTKPQDRPCA
jgi:hypothetical protein